MENKRQYGLCIITPLDDGKEKFCIPTTVVSEDVYKWLGKHDLEIDEFGRRIFICNKVKYMDCGLFFSNKEY